MLHISCIEKTWRGYNLHRKNPKNIYKSCDIVLEFCWYKNFFLHNLAIFVNLKNTDKYFFLIDSFNLYYYYYYVVFKGFFNHHDDIFDDVTKIGYSMPPYTKSILKKRSCHNFCWCYKQNFIMSQNMLLM